MISVRTGSTGIVDRLLFFGANVDESDRCSRTALFLACDLEQEEIVMKLLVIKADPNLQSRSGDSPLIVACRKDHLGIVRILMEHGADPHLEDGYGMNAKQHARSNKIRRALGGVKIMSLS